MVHLRKRRNPLLLEDATDADSSAGAMVRPGAVPRDHSADLTEAGPRRLALHPGREPAASFSHVGGRPRESDSLRDPADPPFDAPSLDPVSSDPTLAALLPVLDAWQRVPRGVVVTSDSALSHHLRRRYSVEIAPEGRTIAGPCLRIPSLNERGPDAVHAALLAFSGGRQILADLLELWTQRSWLGGWAELAAALADLDARCPAGPLHLLAVRARRPDLVAPSAPDLRVEVSGPGPLARLVLRSRGLSFEASGAPALVVPGDAVVELPAWPVALSGKVRLAWGRHGVRVWVAELPGKWTVRAAADAWGEATPVEPDAPVTIGIHGSLTVRNGDQVAFDVRVAPHRKEAAQPTEPALPPPIRRADRKVLLEVILEATASTSPLADALPLLVSRHPSPGAAALAARLGVSPVATVSKWLADPRNDALRLILADGLAATDDPPARRARLPRALRCWIPRWADARQSTQALRLVTVSPPFASATDERAGLPHPSPSTPPIS